MALFAVPEKTPEGLVGYAPEEPAGIELPSWHWSPDGESIAFVQRGGIVRLTLADGGVVPLVDDGGITQLDWR